jgi:hypothetical protein
MNWNGAKKTKEMIGRKNKESRKVQEGEKERERERERETLP